MKRMKLFHPYDCKRFPNCWGFLDLEFIFFPAKNWWGQKSREVGFTGVGKWDPLVLWVRVCLGQNIKKFGGEKRVVLNRSVDRFYFYYFLEQGEG